MVIDYTIPESGNYKFKVVAATIREEDAPLYYYYSWCVVE